MANFAEIKDNIVRRVLVIDDAYEARGNDYLANELGLGGTWIQTSYNGKIRGKLAGVGDYYDPKTDKFYIPKPFPSWIFEPAAPGGWLAPVPRPKKGEYDWDEDSQTWIAKDGN